VGRRKKTAGIALVACAVALTCASSASAIVVSFQVNATGDSPDNSPGDGVCFDNTAGNTCSLRAAIQEANAQAIANPSNTIVISSAAALEGGGHDIALRSSLPPITNPMVTSISGCNASTGAPCTNILPDTFMPPPTPADGFRISNGVDGVAIRGWALSGLENGVVTDAGSDNVKIERNYFGLNFDGTAGAPDTTGVSLSGDHALVGGTNGSTIPGTRNVFAGGTTAIEIAGSDGNNIQGNYIGTLSDGATAAQVGQGILVAGGAVNTPEGNTIGGDDTGTPGVCDGKCNVIAASNNGINLDPNANPPDGTTIAGNNIGLNASGTATVGAQANSAVRAANSPNTTVGGSAAARNYISNAINGIFGLFASVPGQVFTDNFLGLAPTTGASPLGPIGDVSGGYAIAAHSDASSGAAIERNLIALQGNADGIGIIGHDATVVQNRVGTGAGGEMVGGGQIGIDVGAGAVTSGATISENVIGNQSFAGIQVQQTTDSVIQSNTIGENGISGAAPIAGRGISVVSGALLAPSNIVIGGDSVTEPNIIANTGGDAISVTQGGPTALLPDKIFVRDNRGILTDSDAQDLFFDLGDDGFGNTLGMNGGIEPPEVIADGSKAAAGLAEPGSTIRGFQVPDTPPNGITAPVGHVTTDSHGLWTLTYAPFTLTSIGLTKEIAAEGTSELGTASGLPATDATVPIVAITGPASTTSATPTFGIGVTGDVNTRLCAVDAALYTTCGATLTTAPLALGSHTITATAIDDGGNAATPQVLSFSVVSPPPPPALPAKKCKKKKKKHASAAKKKKCKKKKKH
jgi:CSLREA domain-containing protein